MEPDDERGRHVAWVRECSDAMAPHVVGKYVNLLNDEDPDAVRTAYGQRWDRRVALKRRFDPDNLFRHNFNIDPDGDGEDAR